MSSLIQQLSVDPSPMQHLNVDPTTTVAWFSCGHDVELSESQGFIKPDDIPGFGYGDLYGDLLFVRNACVACKLGSQPADQHKYGAVLKPHLVLVFHREAPDYNFMVKLRLCACKYEIVYPLDEVAGFGSSSRKGAKLSWEKCYACQIGLNSVERDERIKITSPRPVSPEFSFDARVRKLFADEYIPKGPVTLLPLNGFVESDDDDNVTIIESLETDEVVVKNEPTESQDDTNIKLLLEAAQYLEAADSDNDVKVKLESTSDDDIMKIKPAGSTD